MTPFFPFPITSTSLHFVICSLNSHQGLWETGIFGDAAHSPCLLTAFGQDPYFGRTQPLSACRALTATGKQICFISSCTKLHGLRHLAQDPPWPLSCCFAALHPFPWRRTSQLCLFPVLQTQEDNYSWEMG